MRGHGHRSCGHETVAYPRQGSSRDVVQPPVFVTATLNPKKKDLLSRGHAAARRSRQYKTRRITKFVLNRLRATITTRDARDPGSNRSNRSGGHVTVACPRQGLSPGLEPIRWSRDRCLPKAGFEPGSPASRHHTAGLPWQLDQIRAAPMILQPELLYL